MGLPSVQVLLDNGTGTFPFDLTNMGGTSYVLLANGWDFSRGRADWQTAVTAGALTLTLNNSDGRFSPGSTIIASPSPIKVDQQIRVKETVNGVTFTRFTGYVKGWPVAWPAVASSFSTVTISATDAQARAERRILRSVPEEEILAAAPDAYYTLGEPAGSVSAADSSGNQRPAFAVTGTGTSVAFGTPSGPPTSALTMAAFTNGMYLSTAYPGPTAYSAGMVFRRNGNPGATETLWSGFGCELVLDTLGRLNVYRLGAFELRTTGSVCDNVFHTVLMSGHVGAGGLGVDGASVGTWASLGVGLAYPQTLTLGGGGTVGATGLNGKICQVSLGTVASVASITTGFANESGTARLTRLAGYAGISVGTLDASLTNVPFVEFTGQSDWSQIQATTDAELGAVFIDGSGKITFHNRNRAPGKTVPDITIAASWVSTNAMPTQDDQQIINYLDVTAQGTGVQQVVWNATSETNHGRYSNSQTYPVLTDAEALDRGNWIISNYAESSTRFGTLTINLYGMPPATAQAVIAAVEVDAWVRIPMMPTQTPGGGVTVDVIVEGYAEMQNGNTWTLTLNVVDRSLFSPVWILDDTTYSVLDSTTRLFV